MPRQAFQGNEIFNSRRDFRLSGQVTLTLTLSFPIDIITTLKAKDGCTLSCIFYLSIILLLQFEYLLYFVVTICNCIMSNDRLKQKRQPLLFFIKSGPLPTTFSLFSSFLTVKSSVKMLPMVGFEPQTSGIGSNRSAN